MQIISGTLDFQLNNDTVVALGKFDGVHKGHKLILDKLWEYHKKYRHTAVITFDMAPFETLTGIRQEVLTTQTEKEMVMESSGVDTMVILPFNKDVAAMEPETFIKDILVDRMHMKVIVVGDDCTFGHKARGNVELLKKYSKEYGYEVISYEKISHEGHIISSTYLRELVKEGRMAEVRAMSRQPYFIYGNISNEGGLRQKFGLPYCVMRISEAKVMPPSGLYYSKVLKEDIFYPAVSFVSKERRLIGTYLFEADRNLGYDNISVGLFDFIREPLPSVDPFRLAEADLIKRFKLDIVEALKWHKENLYIPEDVC